MIVCIILLQWVELNPGWAVSIYDWADLYNVQGKTIPLFDSCPLSTIISSLSCSLGVPSNENLMNCVLSSLQLDFFPFWLSFTMNKKIFQFVVGEDDVHTCSIVIGDWKWQCRGWICINTTCDKINTNTTTDYIPYVELSIFLIYQCFSFFNFF